METPPLHELLERAAAALHNAYGVLGQPTKVTTIAVNDLGGICLRHGPQLEIGWDMAIRPDGSCTAVTSDGQTMVMDDWKNAITMAVITAIAAGA